jgi:hypothetical protein
MILPTFAKAQVPVDPDKLDSFTHAIAKAEGFGPKKNLPTRYHNPGDLKSGSRWRLPDQKGVGKGGHAIFKSDAAGWAALRDLILKMTDGRSKHYNANMTINQIAKKYAGNWRTWAKYVSKELDVPPTTTLRAYLAPEEPPAPSTVATSQLDLSGILNIPVALPILAEN